MRRYLTVLFATLLLCGCSKSEMEVKEVLLDVTPNNIAGVWRLESYDNGKSLAEGAYVYIDCVRSDRTFTLYQNVGSMFVEVKKGMYYIETDSELGAVIYGNYSTEDAHFSDWAHRYIVELTKDTMRWTAKDDREDVSVYVRATLPDFE